MSDNVGFSRFVTYLMGRPHRPLRTSHALLIGLKNNRATVETDPAGFVIAVGCTGVVEGPRVCLATPAS